MHHIRVAGSGAVDSIAPDRLVAEPGDFVRFTAGDRRPHALAFTADSLAPPIRRFLERTQQLRGPPLVNRDAAWVVGLTEAPPGRYPFHCRSHDAHGAIDVRASD